MECVIGDDDLKNVDIDENIGVDSSDATYISEGIGLGLEVTSEVGSTDSAREFFYYLKELPGDIKRKIILILMGRTAIRRYDYSQPLISEFKLALPAVFSPNGNALLVSSFPKNKFGLSIMYSIDAQLFDLATGQATQRLRGGQTVPLPRNKSLSFTSDGKMIVIPSSTGFYVFVAETGELVKDILSKDVPIALSPDGRKYITAAPGDSNDYLLHYTGVDPADVGRESVLLEWNPRWWQDDNDNRTFEFSPDGNLLYSQFDIGLWNGNDGKLVNQIDFCIVLAVSPDSSMIATLSTLATNAVSIVETTNFQVVQSLYTSLSDERLISYVEISPNNSLIALASGKDRENGVFHVWDIISRAKLFTKSGINPKFTRYSDVYVVHSDRTKIMIWRGRTGSLLRTISFSSEIRKSSLDQSDVVASPFGDFIYVGLEDGYQIICCCKSVKKSPLMKFNRCHNNDPSWALFLSLYRLFYVSEISKVGGEVNLGSSSYSETYQRLDESEIFIDFRESLVMKEDPNKEPCCDLSLSWKILLGGLILLVVVPLSPVLIPIGILAFCCCNIRDD
jgi:hypothetical protein